MRTEFILLITSAGYLNEVIQRTIEFMIRLLTTTAVADPGGGPRGPWPPPGPVKIGHKKDGCRRRLHRFHVSRPPLTRPLDPLLNSVYHQVVRFSRIY